MAVLKSVGKSNVECQIFEFLKQESLSPKAYKYKKIRKVLLIKISAARRRASIKLYILFKKKFNKKFIIKWL